MNFSLTYLLTSISLKIQGVGGRILLLILKMSGIIHELKYKKKKMQLYNSNGIR